VPTVRTPHIVALACLGALALLGGCDEGFHEPETPAEIAAARAGAGLMKALGRRDGVAACRLMTPHLQALRLQGTSARDCRDSVEFDRQLTPFARSDLLDGRVYHVEVDGDRATVAYTRYEGGIALFLVRSGGRWRVDDSKLLGP
jgi:hypothetical protein